MKGEKTMKPKIFKTKGIIALALALFMVVPLLFVAVPGTIAAGNPAISAVKGGTMDVTQLPGVAVGNTFTVDVRVDNIAGVTGGINGLSYTVTFDPTVLSLTNIGTKGPFWGSYAGDVTDIVTQGTGSITESAIIINLSDYAENVNAAGVVRTLTFTVLSTGQSNINVNPSDAGVAYLTSPDGFGGSNDVVADHVNAVYNQLYTSISLYAHGTMNSVVQLTQALTQSAALSPLTFTCKTN